MREPSPAEVRILVEREGLPVDPLVNECNVKRYIRQLRDLIIAGRAEPSFLVSHEHSLDEAPMAYEKFDKRIEGYTKVVLKPAA